MEFPLSHHQTTDQAISTAQNMNPKITTVVLKKSWLQLEVRRELDHRSQFGWPAAPNLGLASHSLTGERTKEEESSWKHLSRSLQIYVVSPNQGLAYHVTWTSSFCVVNILFWLVLLSSHRARWKPGSLWTRIGKLAIEVQLQPIPWNSPLTVQPWLSGILAQVQATVKRGSPLPGILECNLKCVPHPGWGVKGDISPD